MSFNYENKVQFKTLAPSLQKIISDKAEKTQVDQISTKLNGIADSFIIGPTDPGATGNKVWFDTNTKYIKVCYNGSGWIPMSAYAY